MRQGGLYTCAVKRHSIGVPQPDVIGIETTTDTTAKLNTDLATLIDDLAGTGVVTDDDVIKYQYRADVLAAELTTCAGHADTGSLGGE